MTQEATKIKATFPSVDWFNAIKSIVNQDEGYKRIGTCDSEVGVKIPRPPEVLQDHFRGVRSG